MSLHSEVARVAYELYEKGGKVDGNDLGHWLDAERIVKNRHNGGKGSARGHATETVKYGRTASSKRSVGKNSSKTIKSKARSTGKAKRPKSE